MGSYNKQQLTQNEWSGGGLDSSDKLIWPVCTVYIEVSWLGQCTDSHKSRLLLSNPGKACILFKFIAVGRDVVLTFTILIVLDTQEYLQYIKELISRTLL